MAELPDKNTQGEDASKAVDAPTPDEGVVLDEATLDALLGAALKEDNKDATPAGPSSADDTDALGQADIDEPLADDDLDKPLVNRDLDSVLAAKAGVPTAPAHAATEKVRPEATSAGESSPSAMLPQDMVDALAVAANEARAAQAAPARTPEDNVVSQKDLDALLADAKAEAKEKRSSRQREMEDARAAPVSPPEARPAETTHPVIEEERVPEEQPRRAPRRGRITRHMRAKALKVFASLSVGVVASFWTFSYLYTHPEQDAGFPVAAVPPSESMPPAIGEKPSPAPGETGVESQAPTEILPPLEGAMPAGPPPPPEGGDAHYVQIASAYREARNQPDSTSIKNLHARINDFISAFPSHSKAVEVLQWKAALYKMEDRPYLAREAYRKILSNYADFPGFDAALVGAAEVANEIGLPKEAMRFAQRLAAEYPDSKYLGAGQKALADAYLATGSVSEAEAIYRRIADSEPGTAGQGGALVGLGRIAVDQGKYDEAIKRLRTRVSMSGPSEGIDEAGLFLAKAYHGAGKLPEAREGLNSLINAFPKSKFLPAAFVELSRVLEDMGSRDNALQVAQQVADAYPKDGAVLRNEASILALAGQYRKAAEALSSAVDSGLNDPQVLLEAARNYRAAQAVTDARKAYERLAIRFPKTPETFVGRLELAELLYQNGMKREGIQQLEQLAASTQEGPQRLPLLVSLAKMYHSLGLEGRAAELSKEIAAGSTEPEVLAQATAVLIDSGARDEGIALAKRIDLSKVSEKSAYALLMEQGKSLLSLDPKKAAGTIERAYTNYPKERTPDADLELVQAYLAADDAAKAKELVSRLAADAGQSPAEAPRLRQVAVALGDYLYDKKDFAGAAEVYGQSLTGDDGKSRESAWAKYQRANALLESGDPAASAPLYDEASKTSSPWSREAAMKANYARAALRLQEQRAAAEPK